MKGKLHVTKDQEQMFVQIASEKHDSKGMDWGCLIRGFRRWTGSHCRKEGPRRIYKEPQKLFFGWSKVDDEFIIK